MTARATDGLGAHRHSVAWSCAAVAVAVVAGAALWFELSLWSIVAFAIALACPLAALWVYGMSRQPLAVPLGTAPQTRGVRLDWLAPWYNALCRVFGVGAGFRDRTLALADLRAGEHVLDVGCGTGALTHRAAAIVGPTGLCRGIDPAPNMIRIAQQTTADVGTPAQFSLGVIERLPFEVQSFDVVFASFVFHCLPPDLKLAGLKEAHRVLRPGGRLVVVDLDKPSGALPRLAARLCLCHPFMAAHIAGQTEALLRQAGFSRIVRAGSWRGLVGFWVSSRAA